MVSGFRSNEFLFDCCFVHRAFALARLTLVPIVEYYLLYMKLT
jgi:hypothetical protein